MMKNENKQTELGHANIECCRPGGIFFYLDPACQIRLQIKREHVRISKEAKFQVISPTSFNVTSTETR